MMEISTNQGYVDFLTRSHFNFRNRHVDSVLGERLKSHRSIKDKPLHSRFFDTDCSILRRPTAEQL